MKRSKMSRKSSRKLFKRTANRYHKRNGMGGMPRGGVAL